MRVSGFSGNPSGPFNGTNTYSFGGFSIANQVTSTPSNVLMVNTHVHHSMEQL